MIYIVQTGAEALADEMQRYAREFPSRDTKASVKRAARRAASAGGSLTPPGKKARDLVPRSKAPVKKEVSKRTDTVRYATHFVVFRRQGKRPFFVPVTLHSNAMVTDNGISPAKTSPDYAAYASAIKRKTRKGLPKTMSSYFKYQERRQSTMGGEKKFYDSPSEISSLRRIRRRGFAKQNWGYLGKRVGGSVTPYKKVAQQSAVVKWTAYRQRFSDSDAEIMMHNKLSYLKKAYGNIEPLILGTAASYLRKEIDARIARRNADLQKKAA